jgi:flavin-dependent dehydrogenase
MFEDFSRANDSLIVKTNKDEYQIKVLIGGDGSLSNVRKKLKLPNKNHIAPTLEIFSPVNPRYDYEYENKQILIDLNPIKKGIQGYVWHFPCIKDGVPSICHGIGNLRVYPSKPTTSMKTIFADELISRNINLGVDSWDSHPIRCFRPGDEISRPNVLLIGDAAGIESAFGGGIHFALSYGDLAAKTIIEAFKNDDFSFDNYEQRMESHIVGKTLGYCADIAHNMYAGNMHPLDAAKKVFSVKELRKGK